jgi:26S proteasome regulatory subunit N12
MTIGMQWSSLSVVLHEDNIFRSVLPPSGRENAIRGLQLIRLLTQNRIADFHTALEALPLSADAIAEDEYLSHPVNLERWLMEGSYSKVWSAREDAPTDEYEFFVDSLMGTIRYACNIFIDTQRKPDSIPYSQK